MSGSFRYRNPKVFILTGQEEDIARNEQTLLCQSSYQPVEVDSVFHREAAGLRSKLVDKNGGAITRDVEFNVSAPVAQRRDSTNREVDALLRR